MSVSLLANSEVSLHKSDAMSDRYEQSRLQHERAGASLAGGVATAFRAGQLPLPITLQAASRALRRAGRGSSSSSAITTAGSTRSSSASKDRLWRGREPRDRIPPRRHRSPSAAGTTSRPSSVSLQPATSLP